MFGFGYNPDVPRQFTASYKCYSISMMPGNERQDVDNGGKIILPPSALELITRFNVSYPILFNLSSDETLRRTHCGVLEFVADEGKCYIPYWMMRNLMIEEGSKVRLETVELPVATYSKFEPQSVEFLDITNPKAMLENALRSFACLTAGDMVAIKYNDKSYELRVLETRPGEAVNIIECDMDVEFAPPVGYIEPQKAETVDQPSSQEPVVFEDPKEFRAFAGQGNRLDGKEASRSSPVPSGANGGKQRRGIPDYDWEVGKLVFFRPIAKTNGVNGPKPFEPFSGSGATLRG